MTYTPGPWTWTGRSEVLAKSHERIARLPRATGSGIVDGELQANARLIAAAPDLLEALRFVLLRFPCLEDKHLPYLRGIVAKATEEVQT